MDRGGSLRDDAAHILNARTLVKAARLHDRVGRGLLLDDAAPRSANTNAAVDQIARSPSCRKV